MKNSVSKKIRRYLLTFMQLLSIYAMTSMGMILLATIPVLFTWNDPRMTDMEDKSYCLQLLFLGAITFISLIILWLFRIIIAKSLKKSGVIPRGLRRMISHGYQWMLMK